MMLRYHYIEHLPVLTKAQNFVGITKYHDFVFGEVPSRVKAMDKYLKSTITLSTTVNPVPTL